MRHDLDFRSFCRASACVTALACTARAMSFYHCVCPSVRHVVVLYLNECTTARGVILVFAPITVTEFQGN